MDQATISGQRPALPTNRKLSLLLRHLLVEPLNAFLKAWIVVALLFGVISGFPSTVEAQYKGDRNIRGYFFRGVRSSQAESVFLYSESPTSDRLDSATLCQDTVLYIGGQESNLQKLASLRGDLTLVFRYNDSATCVEYLSVKRHVQEPEVTVYILNSTLVPWRSIQPVEVLVEANDKPAVGASVTLRASNAKPICWQLLFCNKEPPGKTTYTRTQTTDSSGVAKFHVENISTGFRYLSASVDAHSDLGDRIGSGLKIERYSNLGVVFMKKSIFDYIAKGLSVLFVLSLVTFLAKRRSQTGNKLR